MQEAEYYVNRLRVVKEWADNALDISEQINAFEVKLHEFVTIHCDSIRKTAQSFQNDFNEKFTEVTDITSTHARKVDEYAKVRSTFKYVIKLSL